MSVSDPIADALTVIRNAKRAGKERTDLRASFIVTEIVKILREERFVSDYRLIDDKKQGILRVYFKKSSGEAPRKMNRLQRVSTPGLRVYTAKNEIPRVLNGLGVCILSTPKGILTGENARQKGVGGEVLAKVW